MSFQIAVDIGGTFTDCYLRDPDGRTRSFKTPTTPDDFTEGFLDALAKAVDSITAGFGTWATPWGEVNRFQRTSGAIDLTYDDSLPSLPVPFTSARWGSLASFGARAYPGTHRWYGSSGNSFVAVVEFGDRVSARAITAGGLSNDPSSPHFLDQAERYASGDLREVYFHADQLEGHVERTYRPGER